jgi:hypothetical protein
MEPVLPDAPVEVSEFDLDVRFEAVARHSYDAALASQKQECPDGPSQYVTNCACTALAIAGEPGCG